MVVFTKRIGTTLVKGSRFVHSYKAEKLSVLFFGTDDFSIPTLVGLNKECQPKGCISRLETCCPPMKNLICQTRQVSGELSINIQPWPPDPDVCREFDLGIVASFGHMIPSRIIESFKLGVLNVHGSILPRYRGAAPIPYAILNGDNSTGITIMEVKPFHFDIGPILATEECCIEPDETSKELSVKMADIGSNLLLKVLKDLPVYTTSKKSQPIEGITYAPKITKDMFEIKWKEKTAQEVYNQFRALGNISKLYSYWKNTETIVRFDNPLPPSNISDVDYSAEDLEFCVPGQVVSKKTKKHGRLVCIRCKSGWIAFRKIYYGQRKVMSMSDFHNGFLQNNQKIVDDNLLFTAIDELEES